MWNVGIWDVRDVERENTEWSLIYVIVKDTPNSVIFHFSLSSVIFHRLMMFPFPLSNKIREHPSIFASSFLIFQ